MIPVFIGSIREKVLDKHHIKIILDKHHIKIVPIGISLFICWQQIGIYIEISRAIYTYIFQYMAGIK